MDVDALNAFVKKHWKNKIEAPQEFLKEIVLWSLAEYSQVNKERTNVKTDFNDLFGNMISGFRLRNKLLAKILAREILKLRISTNEFSLDAFSKKILCAHLSIRSSLLLTSANGTWHCRTLQSPFYLDGAQKLISKLTNKFCGRFAVIIGKIRGEHMDRLTREH